MTLKFYTSVTTGLKLKGKKFLGLISMFDFYFYISMRLQKKNCRKGLFAPPPILINLPATDEDVDNLLLVLAIHVLRHKLRFSLVSFILFFEAAWIMRQPSPWQVTQPSKFQSCKLPKIYLKQGRIQDFEKRGALVILVVKQIGVLGALCKPSNWGLGPLPVQE